LYMAIYGYTWQYMVKHGYTWLYFIVYNFLFYTTMIHFNNLT